MHVHFNYNGLSNAQHHCNWCFAKALFSVCIKGDYMASNPNVWNRYDQMDMILKSLYWSFSEYIIVVSETYCDTPKLPPDAAKMSLKDKYRVGEKVKVVCKLTTTDSQDIMCLSNGQWTKQRYVCGSKWFFCS